MAVSTRSRWIKAEQSYELSSLGACGAITSESFRGIVFALLSLRTILPTDSSSTADAAKLRARLRPTLVSVALLSAAAVGCQDKSKKPEEQIQGAGGSSEPPPQELYLPSGGSGAFADLPVVSRRLCPEEMVLVAGRVCVDRYEVSLVDRSSLVSLSPHYPPTELAPRLHATWSKPRKEPVGRLGLLAIPELPELPGVQLKGTAEPTARSVAGVLPQGYLSQKTAELACQNAGKRLCTEEEWLTACRGERHTTFPYGDTYREGVCNIRRASHPARLLHGDASRNHLDPRLGLTEDQDGPLLKKTRDSPGCKSVWGDDAIYDMVGNIDEWVAGPRPAFLGGFFSRATTAGCMARIASHQSTYFDYSLGTRCCKQPG